MSNFNGPIRLKHSVFIDSKISEAIEDAHRARYGKRRGAIQAALERGAVLALAEMLGEAVESPANTPEECAYMDSLLYFLREGNPDVREAIKALLNSAPKEVIESARRKAS